MKSLKLILVGVMMVLLSQVVLSQKEKTYFIDEKGNVSEEKIIHSPFKEVSLRFEKNVPELINQQISQLLKDGKVEVSRKQLKGHYEQVILWYIPKIEVDSCLLSQNGDVSYQGFKTKDEPRMFIWWFLFALLSILFMVIEQIAMSKGKDSFMVFFALSVLFMVAFAISVAVVFSFLSMIVIAVVFLMFALSVLDNKKLANIYMYIYYVYMFAACICIYLQV